MKTLSTSLLVLAFLSVAAPTLADREPDPGLIALSNQLIELEAKIETKLRADQKAWREASKSFRSGVANSLQAASLARHQMERAGLAIELTDAVESEDLRQAVLLRLAAVDLAIDEVAAAQMAEFNQLDAERDAALTALIQLMKRIRANQVELLGHLADKSLAKRLGQIDTGLIATAVTEARRLRANLEGGPAPGPSDLEAVRQRLDDRIADLQRFLSRLSRQSDESDE